MPTPYIYTYTHHPQHQMNISSGSDLMLPAPPTPYPLLSVPRPLTLAVIVQLNPHTALSWVARSRLLFTWKEKVTLSPSTLTGSRGQPSPSTLLLPTPNVLPPYSHSFGANALRPAYTTTCQQQGDSKSMGTVSIATAGLLALHIRPG